MKRIGTAFSLLYAAVTVLPAQTFTTLYSFSGGDGASPAAALVQGTDGNLYGATISGGVQNDGTVFKITTGGTLTKLYNFCSQADCIDGLDPDAALVEAANGKFYGTTYRGGAANQGTVFEIEPDGALTSLYSFCRQGESCRDGAEPNGGLIQGINGDLYGTTEVGGTNGGYGTIFSMTLGGLRTTLYSFDMVHGQNPEAALVQTTDGDLYGTTLHGGLAGYGTVFRITASRTLTVLYSFCVQAACADGANPAAPLIRGIDGNFYGTTFECGEAPGYGTVFQIAPAGALNTLHSFSDSDGICPRAGLLQATDGSFYGTTTGGGTFGGAQCSKSRRPALSRRYTTSALKQTARTARTPLTGWSRRPTGTFTGPPNWAGARMAAGMAAARCSKYP